MVFRQGQNNHVSVNCGARSAAFWRLVVHLLWHVRSAAAAAGGVPLDCRIARDAGPVGCWAVQWGGSRDATREAAAVCSVGGRTCTHNREVKSACAKLYGTVWLVEKMAYTGGAEDGQKVGLDGSHGRFGPAVVGAPPAEASISGSSHPGEAGYQQPPGVRNSSDDGSFSDSDSLSWDDSAQTAIGTPSAESSASEWYARSQDSNTDTSDEEPSSSGATSFYPSAYDWPDDDDKVSTSSDARVDAFAPDFCDELSASTQSAALPGLWNQPGDTWSDLGQDIPDSSTSMHTEEPLAIPQVQCAGAWTRTVPTDPLRLTSTPPALGNAKGQQESNPVSVGTWHDEASMAHAQLNPAALRVTAQRDQGQDLRETPHRELPQPQDSIHRMAALARCKNQSKKGSLDKWKLAETLLLSEDTEAFEKRPDTVTDYGLWVFREDSPTRRPSQANRQVGV